MTNQVGERRLPQLEPRRDGHADAFHTFVRKWVVTLKSVLHSGKTATAEFCRNVYTNHKFVRSVAFTLFYVHTLLQFTRLRKDEKQKTLLFMINSLSDGGAERVVATLTSDLARRWRVVILSIKENYISYPIDPDVRVLLLPKALFIPEFRRIIPSVELRLLVFLAKFLKKKLGVYATISFLCDMNHLNASSKGVGKVICCERNNPFKDAAIFRAIDQIKTNYEHADHVVFQTEDVRNLFSDKVKEHSSILRNPIDVACERKSVVKKRIVNVGRLVPQKNQAMLIRAFKRFHDLRPEYTLSIYGRGYLKDDLKKLVENLNLKKVVVLEGQSSQIHRDIADAEFFVLSSDYEGYSNALLEAMTMGLPCISTDCEGSTDAITNGVDGVIVPRGDEDALFKAMLTFAEHEDFREQLGKQAKKTEERFQCKRVVQEWEETIKLV